MKVRFDKFNRHDDLKLMLCNPGSKFTSTNINDSSEGVCSNSVGMINNATDVELNINFNSTSTLSFRVSYIENASEDPDIWSNTIFDKLTNRRLIFIRDFGYFSITDVSRGRDESGLAYKDIEATSAECEISNRTMPYIEDGTYNFSTLLTTVVNTVPIWEIGSINQSVGALYRTFEDVGTDQNILSFLLENMQDAYECIFEFDTVNRKINVYDQNDYSAATSIHISKDDIIKSFSISENSDDIYTALSVSGGDDDTSISAINPTGSSVIYNFDYYLDWMTSALSTKVQTWQSAINDIMSPTSEYSFRTIVSDYYTAISNMSNAQAEVDRLTTLKSIYERCLSNVIAEINSSSTITNTAQDVVRKVNESVADYGGTPIDTTGMDVDALKTTISNLISQADEDLSEARIALTAATITRDDKKALRDAYTNTYAITKYFNGAGEMDELSNYIYEGSYKDEYVTLTDSMTWAEKLDQLTQMYTRAKKTLDKTCIPTSEFRIDVNNFAFVKDFESFTDQLSVGCTINAELEDGVITPLFLTNITINYEDSNMSMTFGNRYGRFDTKSMFEDVLGNIQKSSNSIDYIKETIYPVKRGDINRLDQQMQSVRNMTMASAMTNTEEQVVIDGTGITSRRFDKTLDKFDDEQIKINGKSIIFTDDGWDTCKMAVGRLATGDNTSAYGINAEVLYGKLIMGQNLNIYDSNGNVILSVGEGDDPQLRGKLIDSINGDFSNICTVTPDGIKIRQMVDTQEGRKEGKFSILINSLGMYFYDEDSTVAYIQNNQLNISEAIAQKLWIATKTDGAIAVDAGFTFSPRDGGGMTVKWEDPA